MDILSKFIYNNNSNNNNSNKNNIFTIIICTHVNINITILYVYILYIYIDICVPHPECVDIPSLLIWIKPVVLSKHHPEKLRLNYKMP